MSITNLKKEIMRKLFLSLIIFATVSFGAFASPQKGDKHKGDGTRVYKELNLSSEQQEKVKSINKDFKAKFDALKEDKSLAKETKREKMKELAESKRNQFQAVLTPDQQSKLSELRNTKMQPHKQGRKDFDKGGRNHMKDLNLSEDQKTKMQSLKKDFRSKMQALKDDSSLTKEARAEKRKELAQSHKSEMQSLLTPEQQSKWKDWKDKFRRDYKHNGKFSGKKGHKDGRMKFDSATTAKLETLRKDFQKQKQAVELSRIAPDAQKERIKDLREKYRTDRKNIINEARQKKEGNKTV